VGGISHWDNSERDPLIYISPFEIEFPPVDYLCTSPHSRFGASHLNKHNGGGILDPTFTSSGLWTS
jgi:hypothetical protein